MDPNFAQAHLVLGKVYELKYNLALAVAEFDLTGKLSGGAPNVWALQAHALALSGKRNEALMLVRRMHEASRNRYVSGVDIAIAYCGLGDSENAMKSLDRAYVNRDKGLDILAADPLFEPCRSDPRFQALLKRLQLIS